MAEIFSESVNYKSVKQRAVAARSYRTKITPSNGATFSDGDTINIDLPGNLAGTYYNSNQWYLKFKVKNTDTANGVVLDRAGAASFIKRIQISQAGAQLQDLNNWNVLYTALLDSDASSEWKGSSGAILQGTRGDCLKGEDLAANTERTYCVPMCLNVLSNTTPHRLIPAFSLGALQWKITLDNAAVATQGAVGIANLALKFSDVEFVCLMTELSPSAQAKVDAMNGGQYNILANSYMNAGASMVAGSTTFTANLGISVSSLERIICITRPQSSDNDKTKFSLGNRAKNKLLRFQYFINSEAYPQRPIETGDKCAEILAENLIASHSLVNFREGNGLMKGVAKSALFNTLSNDMTGSDPALALSNPFNVDAPTGSTAGALAATLANSVESNIGTFLASCEFETGLSDGKSATIYSGISTISSVVQFRGEYGAGAVDANLDFFAQYTSLISLDMRGTGVFSISV
tara:strand:- start:755 stop:2143 length:1389 start_codon:yes stop_codon:yes gene_type:complete